jgi:DnaK suppressor protein
MAKKKKKTPKTKTRKSRARPAPRKAAVRLAPVKPKVRRTPEEKPLPESLVLKFRELLVQKRDDLLAVVQRKKEQEIQVDETEIGDEADIATRSVEKEMLFELTDSEKQTLDKIEAALRKIETGVYGRCESCQSVISRLRMEVMPWARYCIACQAQNEVPASE